MAPEGPERDPLTGRFKIQARGMIVIMAAWGSQRLTPGQYALWVSQPAFQGAQFQLSPANTTVGFSLDGVSFHDWKISGALDLTLKSPSPANRTILAPLFYDIHIAAVRRNVYLLIGQFPDVILPFAPASTNGFPGSYIPGQIGFYRPQLRAGTKIDLNETFDLRLQGSIGRDIQNFEVSPLVIGAGAGYPDLQGRVSVAAGRDTREPAAPWKRAYEVGVAGHWGGRTFGLVTDDEVTLVKRNTWSFVVDARAELPTGTLLRGRVWTGRTLQDYAAASFQSINAALESIDASGFWIDLRQRLARSWTASLGYGRDDPVDGDLDPGQRALSESAFLNAYWHWSRRVTFAAQLSWWHTDWKALGNPEVWRGEVLTAIRY